MISEPAAAFAVRRARTSDVPLIEALIAPLVQDRILLGKDRVVFYEAVQEFRVAETDDGTLIGCGALHVMWEDIGEVRTLAVAADRRTRGVGRALLERLEADARDLGLTRLFCLTFETRFFTEHGYGDIGEALCRPMSTPNSCAHPMKASPSSSISHG